MQLNNPDATIVVPDLEPVDAALRRITHLGIGAHQDDCEIMAFHGILECYHRPDRWFGAVTCTNGSGSPRAGEYAAYSDEEMARLRRGEQDKAAVVGNYGCLVQLNHSSAAVKDVRDPSLLEDLAALLDACRPEVVYTHNPADKHETHLAVGLTTVRAIRSLPADVRPRAVFGCEVWRGLDWLADASKIALDVSGHENLAAALIGVYDSQVAGGKRYDLATIGRRRANATYFASHATDKAEALSFALDLTPLVRDESLDIAGFVLGHVDDFRRDVEAKLRKYLPGRT
jgi:LmbE family N-acetylglucosaminyl deacetylase